VKQAPPPFGTGTQIQKRLALGAEFDPSWKYAARLTRFPVSKPVTIIAEFLHANLPCTRRLEAADVRPDWRSIKVEDV
jgi:hypothetical protein